MRMVPEDAGRCWSLAREGDSEAFGQVFDAYRDRVYRHALRLVDADRAEDVTAVAFLELWRRRGAVRVVDGNVLPWLLVTATNVARNQRRSSVRYRRFLARLPSSAASTPSAADEMQVLDLDPTLLAALKALRAADLHLLVLVSIEDYSLADAAAVLGITEAAAKSRMHRVRTRIRDTASPESITDQPGWSTPQ